MPSRPNDDGPFVLLVDDFRSALIPLRRLLETYGVPSLEAGSAHVALELLETHIVTVVVADYMMPVRDGISLLDEVAERWPDVARLLYSGHFDADLVLEAHGSKHRAVSKAATDVLVDTVLKLHREALARHP